MTAQPVIQAVGLTKVFRDFWRRARVRAVGDLDFEVQSGEIFGLLGPNGSGKSTTIKMLLGLLHPTRGRVSVFGRPPDDVRTKSRIGYLPEESYLYRFLNARETLDYYGRLFQLERSERRRRTEELLEMVGLRSAARRPVGEYSKGMARRIGLAQALINDPDLLILDEPTSGLDPVGSKLVKDIILRLGSLYRKTILLSSHLLADVEEVCTRVTILYGGRVQKTGSLDEILAQRHRTQLVVDALAPETLRAVQDLLERLEGKTAEVSVPKDRLEALFLRIVQEASARRLETTGSVAAGEIAGFLGGTPEARQVLEELVRTEPVQAAAPPAAAPAPAAIDTAVLTELTAAARKPGAEDTEQAAPPQPQPEVDRSVIDELLGPDQRKGSP